MFFMCSILLFIFLNCCLLVIWKFLSCLRWVCFWLIIMILMNLLFFFCLLEILVYVFLGLIYGSLIYGFRCCGVVVGMKNFLWIICWYVWFIMLENFFWWNMVVMRWVLMFWIDFIMWMLDVCLKCCEWMLF